MLINVEGDRPFGSGSATPRRDAMLKARVQFSHPVTRYPVISEFH